MPGQAGHATRTGFTLIEVLMAAFVLALGVLGLAAMFAGAARQQQLASQQTRSVTISQSADAMISENVGKLGFTGDVDISNVNIYPGQPLAYAQWFVVPIKLDKTSVSPFSFLSINPNDQWGPGHPFFRETPHQQLPRLIYRAIPDGSGRWLVGRSRWDKQAANNDPFTYGAPAFDGSFGVPRVLADSVQIRVVTMGYGCGVGSRDINLASPATITLSLDPTYDNESGDELPLVGSDDGQRQGVVNQQRRASDDQFALNPDQYGAEITFLDIANVIGGETDVNCDGKPDYVEVSTGGQAVFTDGNMSATGASRFSLSAGGGQSAYRPRGDGVHMDLLSPHDAGQNVPANARVLLSGGGPYTLINGPGTVDAGFRVKPIDADWRYVSEIWLDSFEYRGHRLVSTSDRVWYTKDPSRPSGRRADVAYSVLYRDNGTGAGAQYIIFTYALRPSSNTTDYIPPERPDDIAGGVSPVTLVEGVTLAFDSNLGKYYIELPADDDNAWITQPRQILVFAGDGSVNPPIPGADSPVRVLSQRTFDDKVRGYLERAPRVGNKSLLEDASPTTKFDIWGVQPTVQSLDENGNPDPANEWGLRPIEARVFEVFGS